MDLYTLLFADWYFWAIVVIGTTIWMGYDSARHRIAVDSKPYTANNGAPAWVLSGLLLWIATFPFYLYKRSAALARGAVPVTPAPPVQPARSIAAELEALNSLKASGGINENDYQRAKSKILS